MADETGKPTVEDLINALGQSVDAGFREMKADVGLVASDLNVVKGGLKNVVDRVDIIEARRPVSSDRVKSLVSSSDLGHAAALGDEIVARQALQTKVDGLISSQAAQMAILDRVDTFVKRFASSPYVIKIAKLAAAVVIGWLAAHLGMKL